MCTSTKNTTRKKDESKIHSNVTIWSILTYYIWSKHTSMSSPFWTSYNIQILCYELLCSKKSKTCFIIIFQNVNARERQNDKEKYFKQDRRKTTLNRTETLGEIFYIMQPLAHLSSLAMFGRRSWRPWIISMGMELLRYVMNDEL